MTEYCINKFKMAYNLTWKLQTDAPEVRFGLYTQMSGSQYHISLRNIWIKLIICDNGIVFKVNSKNK